MSPRLWWVVKAGGPRNKRATYCAVKIKLHTLLELHLRLTERFQALSAHPLDYGMEYSENQKQTSAWIPLVMEGGMPAKLSRRLEW